MAQENAVVDALVELGLSQYEARCYVGLLDEYGQTAYSVSKATGVPQPKVYEALRKLVDRNAAVVVGSDPQLFAAIPPDALLARLRGEFHQRADLAETELNRKVQSTDRQDIWPHVVVSLTAREAMLSHASALIQASSNKIYVSAWAEEFDKLADDIRGAEARGVLVVAMTFSRKPISLTSGLVYRHDTTSKMVYPNHKNRHLALVCDGKDAIWGQFSPERQWTALASHDQRMVSLVRGFIRHDIYVNKTYEQFGPDMESVFGPGLELLADVFQDVVLRDRKHGDVLGDGTSNAKLDRRVV